MKKVLSIILSIIMIMTAIPFAFAAEEAKPLTLDISEGSIKIYSDGYDVNEGEKIAYTGDYIITGTTDAYRLEIELTNATDEVNVTFKDLLIDHRRSDWSWPFKIYTGIANVTLEGYSSISGGYNCSGLEIDNNATLVITEESTGSLYSYGDESYSIGGRAYWPSTGTFIMNGGTVTADASYSYEAAIGQNGEGGNFTFIFNGGNLTTKYVHAETVKLYGGTFKDGAKFENVKIGDALGCGGTIKNASGTALSADTKSIDETFTINVSGEACTMPEGADCTEGYTCTVCGMNFAAVEKHTEGTAATCVDKPVCSVCGQSYDEALGHDIVVDAYKAPTCAETGLTEGQHCSRCDDMTIAQEEIPVVDHEDADGDTYCDHGGEQLTCKDCGRPVHEGFMNEIICWFLMLINLVKSMFA